MKTAILVILYLIYSSTLCIAEDSTYVPQFFLFTKYEETYTCAKNPLVSDINYFKNNFPNSKITVFVIIDDENDFNPYIKKQFAVDNVLPDLNANIAKSYGLSKYPAMVMLNHHGDILLRNDNVTKEKKKSPKKIQRYYELDFLEEEVAFENDEYNQIVVPKTDCVLLSDSILTLIDMMKNTLSQYSTKDGKLIRQLEPADTVLNFFSYRFSNEQKERFKSLSLAMSEYHSIVQESNKMLLIFSNISPLACKIDSNSTSQITRCNARRSTLLAFVLNDTVTKIDDNANKNEIVQFPKVSLGGLFFSNVINPSNFELTENSKHNKILLSDDISFNNTDKLLPLEDVLEYYKPYPEKSLINSFPCLDYIDEDSTFIYLDPWNSFFFKYHIKNGFQNKIEPFGMLRTIFNQTEKYGEHSKLGMDDFKNKYYLNNMIVLDEHIYILIIATNESTHKNFMAIQKYYANGEFIRETIISSETDIIKRVDFARSKDSKNLHLLLNTKEKRWRLYKIPLEKL